ncbi:MAG: PQQ-binding-like beta-propeller repeat protein [Pseudomonadota bacterium]|nr:PQQ-binding-like beta-propeller repeat protein [Pseudomonadota bacterium]
MRAAVFAAQIALGLLLLAGGSLHAEDWPMYGRDLQHSFSNPQSAINPFNVLTLKEVWFHRTGDVVSASPAVVGGVVYVGSWDGFFYALDAHSGQQIWAFKADCQKTVVPVPPGCPQPVPPPPPRATSDGGIITSSAAVIGGNVYFGAGKTLYSLRASDGYLNWKTVICGNPGPGCENDANDPTRIFSSPAVSGGTIFVGHTADGAAGYRGGFEAIDAASSKVVWRFETDPKLNFNGQPIGGGINRGCGSVWSSAAVDPDPTAHLVYFGTGDCGQDAPPPYHEAVIALDSITGAPKWVFRPRPTDKCDFDFGASPNIIDFGVSGHYLGLGGKDGTYYLLNRLTNNPAGQLIWATRVVFGGGIGGFFGGAAFDGKHIFSSTAVGDFDPKTPSKVCMPGTPGDTLVQDPSMHALNVANGSRYWERPLNYSFGATTLANGVVFSGSLVLPSLNAYVASGPLHGLLLKVFDKTSGITGQVNSAAVPVGRMLFVTTGNTADGSGGGVHAFALPAWVP